ncbi:hypothetical protein F0562_021182 [Nyssa sinensis]|uniref:Hexosyltransferase n=1 Tax=Nyssa sinensis TaxID=561372 RepID=A0A5J5BJN3_9ASTE|nr:hypothetical protein F0562_021182 [Nyssa sinensis]
MRQFRRWMRISILSLLAVSVFIPIFLLSDRLKNITSEASKVFIEDLTSLKYRRDALKLRAIEQEEGKGLKGPTPIVYKDEDFNSVVSYSSFDENINSQESGNARRSTNMLEGNGTDNDGKEDNDKSQQEKLSSTSGGKELSKQTAVRNNQTAQSQSVKVKQMKDQVIRAKAYLSFAPPNSNSQLVRELKLRIKEVERVLGEATKDSDLSKSAMQWMKAMESSLLKASRVYRDCPAMATKLRAMTYNAEEQVKAQKNQAAFLVQLAGRTTPKGLHCLSMRLTAEYFTLQPEEREFPNQHKLHDPDLSHFAVFSDNILACAVVVSSTISSAMEPEKIIFHVVTDSLNLPAISMWFLLNPPGKATIQGLWTVNMNGKVNGAVETCQEGEPSSRRMDMFINFSDPMVAKRFGVKTCTWAFGMNMFDLQVWRRQNLTGLYHKYLQLGNKRPLWKAGSLPLGWITFYNQTVALDRRWHVLGLGYDSGVGQGDIERACSDTL